MSVYILLRSKFFSILLYDQPFSRYNVFENQKCTEGTRTDLKTHYSQTYPK